MKNRIIKISAFFVLSLFLLTSQSVGRVDSKPLMNDLNGTIFFVKPNSYSNCMSWSNACDLQTAIYQAQPGDQIWVAKGTYKPTTTTNRDVSFQLESGVALYGGFPSTGGDWYSRNWTINKTILSGDIGVLGYLDDNSYHVVTANNVDNTAILNGFVIVYGRAYPSFGKGGGIYAINGSPILTNLQISSNSSNSYGGGIYLSGSQSTFDNVIVSYNYSGDHGGGAYIDESNITITNSTFVGNDANGFFPEGGGLFVYGGDAMMSNLTFLQNEASLGGGLASSGSNIKIMDSVFNDNTSWVGAAYKLSGGYCEIEDTTFQGNSATSNGGGISVGSAQLILMNSYFFDNYSGGSGGGINVGWYTNVDVSNVIFAGNVAVENGGGIYSDDDLNAIDVLFTENSAANGGGVFSEEVATLTNVIFYNNDAEIFGGGFRSRNNPSLTNVTFSYNDAGSSGGGMYHGGGTYGDSYPVLTNVTFFGNNAVYGGGLSVDSGEATISNSVFWDNSPNSIHNNLGLVSVSYSDIQYGFLGEGNISTDPLLQDLADNGGFTPTHALDNESPAIDAGDPNNCPATDQRGFPRPFDGDNNGVATCDMGAYEWQTATIDVSIIGAGNVSMNPEKPFYIAGEKVSLAAYPANNWLFSNWSGDIYSHKNPIDVVAINDLEIIATFVEITSRIYMPLIGR